MSKSKFADMSPGELRTYLKAHKYNNLSGMSRSELIALAESINNKPSKSKAKPKDDDWDEELEEEEEEEEEDGDDWEEEEEPDEEELDDDEEEEKHQNKKTKEKQTAMKTKTDKKAGNPAGNPKALKAAVKAATGTNDLLRKKGLWVKGCQFLSGEEKAMLLKAKNQNDPAAKKVYALLNKKLSSFQLKPGDAFGGNKKAAKVSTKTKANVKTKPQPKDLRKKK